MADLTDKVGVEVEEEGVEEDLISWFEMYHGLMESIVDSFKDEINTIKNRKIDKNKSILERDKTPGALRLSKNIVVGFNDAIAKVVKDLQTQGGSMSEDLQRRYNLPADWPQAFSIMGSSLAGSDAMGPVSAAQRQEKNERILQFVDEAVKVNSQGKSFDVENGRSGSGSSSGKKSPESECQQNGENSRDTDDNKDEDLFSDVSESAKAKKLNEKCETGKNISNEGLQDGISDSSSEEPTSSKTVAMSMSASTPSKSDSKLVSGKNKNKIEIKQESQEKTPRKKVSITPSPSPSSSSTKKTDELTREKVSDSDGGADSDSSGKTCVIPTKLNQLKTPSKSQVDPSNIKKESSKGKSPKSKSASPLDDGEEKEKNFVTPKSSPSPVKTEKKKESEGKDNSVLEKSISDDVGNGANGSNSSQTQAVMPLADDDDFMDFLAPPSPTGSEELDFDDTRTVVLAPRKLVDPLSDFGKGQNSETISESNEVQPSSSNSVSKTSVANDGKQKGSENENNFEEVDDNETDEKVGLKNENQHELDESANEENKPKDGPSKNDKTSWSKEEKKWKNKVLGSSSESETDSGRRKNKLSSEGGRKNPNKDSKTSKAVSPLKQNYDYKKDAKLKENAALVKVVKLDSAIEKVLAEKKYIRLRDYDQFKKLSCKDLEKDDDDTWDSDDSGRSNEQLERLVKNLTKASILCSKQYSKKRGDESGGRRGKKLRKTRSTKRGGSDMISNSESSDSDSDIDQRKRGSGRSPLKLNHDEMLSDSGSEDLLDVESDASDNTKRRSSRIKAEAKAKDSKGKKQKHYQEVKISSCSDSDARREVIGSSSESDKEKRKQKAKKVDNVSGSSDSDFVSGIGKKKKQTLKKKQSNSDSDISLISIHTTDSDSDFKTSKKSAKRRRERVSSSETEKHEKKKKKRRRIKTASDDSDSSDIQEIPQDEKEKESEEPGSRKNIRKIMSKRDLAKTTREAEKDEEERRKRLEEKQKQFNGVHKAPDSNTLEKLVLDIDAETKEPAIEVDPTIVKHLKPHQAEGIQFMYNACFESIDMIKKNKVPGGCILAHCMGLGKTLQSVAFIHTVLTNKICDVNRALIICPLSTVENWFKEFKSWTEDATTTLKLHKLYEMKNTGNSRFDYLNTWKKRGGVGIIHYPLFRILVDPKGKSKMKETLKRIIKEALLDPGPDIVICDEGHILKNCKSILSLAVSNIRTHRRIALTGTPLQNNLVEYHTMMNFVKPNLLGSLQEFTNRFANPIKNGQHADSTSTDVKTMKWRSHVLHRKLEGCVQRFDYSILSPYLPPKYEYIIYIKLSGKQEELYNYYLTNVVDSNIQVKRRSLLKYYAELVKVWSHPIALTMRKEKDVDAETETTEDSLKDFIVDKSTSSEDESGESSNSKGNSSETSKRKTRSEGLDPDDTSNSNGVDVTMAGKWWNEVFKSKEEMYDVQLSGKLIILQEIIKTCETIGDKVLVFSQFLTSLDIIEEFLSDWDQQVEEEEKKKEVTFPYTGSEGRWRRNIEYFRIDGQTKSSDRHRDCEKFNKKLSKAKLFLISTRAGGLGINLFGANRVVIFDASWNPSQDMQSIFRVYRFGQDKPCYIYRLVARGTMEEKILRRQITKLSISSRVVDEHQIQRHFKFDDVQEMYRYEEEDPSSEDAVLAVPKDRLLADLLISHRNWIRNYEEFDSLLENRPDEGLTNEEKEVAWAQYKLEQTKRQSTHPNHATQQAETYVKVRGRLSLNYPTANEEQLDEATTVSLEAIEKIRAAMLHLNQRGHIPEQKKVLEQYITPLKLWLAKFVQEGNTTPNPAPETGSILPPLPPEFYQPVPILMPQPQLNPYLYHQHQQQYQQGVRPPIIRRNHLGPGWNQQQPQQPMQNIQNTFSNIARNQLGQPIFNNVLPMGRGHLEQ